MGEDITKLKASIKNISRIIGRKPVDKIPKQEEKSATPQPITNKRPGRNR